VIVLDNKLITIITPTYNCAHTIERTIQSVLCQDDELFEYLVIDGGSSDGTVHILQQYADKLTYITEEDNGIYDAMNKGIRASSGEFLYFLGSGDCLDEGVLHRIGPFLLRDESSIVYGNVMRLDTNKLYGKKFSSYRISVKNICHQAIFYHHSVFDLLGLYSLDYNVLADHVFNMQCFGKQQIKKKHVDLTIATYAGFGLSHSIRDNRFYAEQGRLVWDHLGITRFIYYFIYNNMKRIVKWMIGGLR
jgi:glycosyltransferase involved in cell wall biosynthesis